MKVNPRHVITCALTNQEVKDFEAWGTAMDLNINQAMKQSIAYAIKNLKPNKAAEQQGATAVQ
ncbi:MAG: hypothetical protein ACLP19_18955 [Xanthobacteraceae bacterium]